MKKGLLIAISGVIVVAVAAGAYVVGVKSDETTTKPTETSSVSEVTESTTAETTTESTTESTTEETTTEKLNEVFVIKGTYYVYDDSKTLCYAFTFNKNGKVNVAQFEEINIVYEDPQYEKGDTSYKVDGNKVIIKKMPGDMSLGSVEFTIKEGKLYLDGKKVEHHDDLKMSYAISHFE